VILLLLIGLASLGASVVLAARAAGQRRAFVAATLDGIGHYGFQTPSALDEGVRNGLLGRFDRLADRVGDLASGLGWLREAEVRKLLRAAGAHKMTPRKILGYRIIATVGLPALWLWLAAGGSPARALLGVVFAALIGWHGPLVVLRRRGRLRLDEIDYAMPELVDLLVTTVEAGLGLAAAMEVAARRLKGPLGEELRLTLAEQEMGLSTEDALANMLERADTPAVRSLVRSLTQGATLGVSIGKILRDLADEMRKRRRQKAEERAQKAPTKLLFPLIFLIFPAMFVVLLGPAVHAFMSALGGK
jgi:tight adherence protein C